MAASTAPVDPAARYQAAGPIFLGHASATPRPRLGHASATPRQLRETVGEPASHDEAPSEAKENAVQVVLIDDHQTVAEAIASLMERQPDLEVIGEAGTGRIGIEVVRDLRPDVVIMDVNLPDISGIDATREIVAAHPEIRVIGLSMDNSAKTAAAILAAGAALFLPKDAPAVDLIAAIRKSGRYGSP